jgi:hypothetical protein
MMSAKHPKNEKTFLQLQTTLEPEDGRSFNAQIEFTMHEMERFMISCEKLMTVRREEEEEETMMMLRD